MTEGTLHRTSTPDHGLGQCPRVHGLIESSIYVKDLGWAREFYERVLNLSVAGNASSSRLVAFWVGPGQVLLVCKRGGSLGAIELRGGRIPPHDGRGPLHFAIGVDEDSREQWRHRLAQFDIPITGEVDWSTGGWSLYFDDPDGHVIELKSSDWNGRPVPGGST